MFARACVRTPAPVCGPTFARASVAPRRCAADSSASAKLHKIEAPSWEEYKRDKYSDAKTRKSYTYLVTGAAAAGSLAGVKNVALDVIDSMNASADVLALANIEVDLSTIPEGNAVTMKWRGKPLFIRHRTPAEIEAAESVPMSALTDPQPDSARRKKAEWLILLGVCTHLGCVPINAAGDYRGWFCPCHGTHYDTSGRTRKGPAPRNLEVPPYKFLEETKVVVGTEV